MDENFKKEFIKGSVASTIGTTASLGFHFLSIMILTRCLKQNEFGIYALIIVLANFFNIIAGLGLNITIVKFLTNKDEYENKASLRAILIMRVLHLGFFTIVFYMFSGYIMPLFSLPTDAFIPFIPVLFILISFRDLNFNILQGLGYFKKYSLVQIISSAFRVGIILMFHYLKILDLYHIIFIEIFTTAVSVLIQMIVIPFRRLVDQKPTIQTYKHIISFSGPVYINNILTFVYDRVSIFLLGIMLSPVSVALFDVSNKIPEALQRFFISFMIVYFPNSAKLFSEGRKQEALLLMNKSLNFFSVIITFFVFFSFLYSKEIIGILFSKQYIIAAPAFALLMFNLFLRIMSNIKGYSIVSAGFPAVPTKVNVVASVLNIGVSYLIIPKYGFMGAVYSVLFMNIVTQVIYHLYLIKLQLYPDGINYLKPVFIVAIFGIVPFYFDLHSFILKLLLTFAFLVCNWVLLPDFRNLYPTGKKYLKKIIEKPKPEFS